jgi:hypothetical protein
MREELEGLSMERNLETSKNDIKFIPVDKKSITTEERDLYQNARYQVTTVVPHVDNPYKNVYLLDDPGFYQLQANLQESGEFIINVERVPKIPK